MFHYSTLIKRGFKKNWEDFWLCRVRSKASGLLTADFSHADVLRLLNNEALRGDRSKDKRTSSKRNRLLHYKGRSAFLCKVKLLILINGTSKGFDMKVTERLTRWLIMPITGKFAIRTIYSKSEILEISVRQLSQPKFAPQWHPLKCYQRGP